MSRSAIVSRDDWTAARLDLLKREKALTRALDEVRAARQKLPWVEVDKDYVFEGADGPRSLSDLFEGRSQLIVHHLMFAPDWNAACVGCSFQADHIDGPGQHLEHHDVRIVAVSRASVEKLEAYRKRMGWRFEWVSSLNSDFNRDFGVHFPADATGSMDYNFGTFTVDPSVHGEELPGISVFCRDEEGRIFHSYSTYARGLDMLLGANHYLDLTPNGRNEPKGSGHGWIRRHDEYEDGRSAAE